jgi:tetratricopeptide (TPR) repeat protein
MSEENAVAEKRRGEAEMETFRDYQKIQSLISLGKDEEAIGALEDFLRPPPFHSAAHDDLGVLYFRRGERERAAAHFLKSIEADPGNYNAMKNLADLSAETGQWEEAFHLYGRVLEGIPDDPEALRGAAIACAEKGLQEDADFFYRRFREVESRRPSSPVPPGEPGGCGENLIPRRGAAGKEEPPGSPPVSGEAWLERGERLFEEGKLEEARRIFEGVLAAHPSNAQALNNLGVMALLEEKSDRAVTYFSRALEADPQNLDAQTNLAHSLVAKGLHREAIPWLEKSLLSNPRDAALWNSLGSCFLSLGDQNRAEEVFSHSYRLDQSQKELPEILGVLRKDGGISFPKA